MTRLALAPATALAAILALPAYADVTAEEVWHNLSRPIAAMGVNVAASPMREGDVLRVGPVIYSYELPEDAGRVELRSVGPEITEAGDGTVTLLWPEEMEITLDVDAVVEGEPAHFRAAMDMTLDQQGSASGTPGSITYETTGSSLSLTLTEVEIEDPTGPDLPPEMDGPPNFAFFMDYEMDSTSTITAEGEGPVSMTADVTMTDMVQDLMMELPGETSTRSVSTAEQMTTTARIELPAEAPDMTNLAAALSRGLSLEVTTDGSNSQSQSVSSDFDSQVTMDQMQSLGHQTGTVRLNADGLFFDAAARDFALDITAPDIGFPISLTAQSGSFNMTVPLMASEETQEGRYAFRFEELNGSDDLWAMIDPTGALPHDPVTMGLVLTADLVILQDLLDFDGMREMIDAGESPIDLTSIAFGNFDVQALGAQLTGDGSFDVDLTPLIETGAEPILDGTAEFDLTGLNAALDTLSSSGMIPPQAIMGVRMSIGMFAEVSGEDALHSLIEVRPDGSVLANGQPIR
ncbi:DUF2125 domain-containing protein [Pseudoroseicyclus tamaricis]|uniref:DUF2125 domain-containing protein n=1 Tax=Pseudoroseicyclus tamaricis TaxID=2705421 RepID=A0A6B2K5N7_9RHOB|nr:DUF2125 domain-containing protein [Pseudoroseicyclus tamaricis]NDV02106.1 DUF2125 domain-containing protein [Pseudoroseicyclus tamaricis]